MCFCKIKRERACTCVDMSRFGEVNPSWSHVLHLNTNIYMHMKKSDRDAL